MECDGVISYDRTAKFSGAQIASIKKANDALVGTPTKCDPIPPAVGMSAVPRWLWG